MDPIAHLLLPRPRFNLRPASSPTCAGMPSYLCRRPTMKATMSFTFAPHASRDGDYLFIWCVMPPNVWWNDILPNKCHWPFWWISRIGKWRRGAMYKNGSRAFVNCHVCSRSITSCSLMRKPRPILTNCSKMCNKRLACPHGYIAAIPKTSYKQNTA